MSKVLQEEDLLQMACVKCKGPFLLAKSQWWSLPSFMVVQPLERPGFQALVTWLWLLTSAFQSLTQ